MDKFKQLARVVLIHSSDQNARHENQLAPGIRRYDL